MTETAATGRPDDARYHVATYPLSAIAAARPDRGLVVADHEGEGYQLYAWELPTGRLRRLTDVAHGVTIFADNRLIAPDGRFFFTLQDDKGNELGHLVRQPWTGGTPLDLTPALKPYSLRGLSMSLDGRSLAFNGVNDDGFQLYYLPFDAGDVPGEPRLIHQSQLSFWDAHISPDGQQLAVISTERTGTRHFSILLFDPAGRRLAELWDGPETSVEIGRFAPRPGDGRLLGVSDRTGYKRPFIWDPATGDRIDLPLPDLAGDVLALDWLADGGQLLLLHFHRAVQQLYRYDLARETAVRLEHPAGALGIYGGIVGRPAYFHPDGSILAHWQDARHPVQLIRLDGQTGRREQTLLAATDVPPGRPLQSVTFPSSDGQLIQGWLGLPDGDGPFPTVLNMHGGPHMVVTENYEPGIQGWLDAGFAYLTINYRGSTSFGRDFMGQIWGNIGHWELEDMVAARAWLVDQGIARPDAVFLNGGSYGGYLTLYGLGRRPELWAGGMALVAIGDWTRNYYEASGALRGAFANWFQGTPEEIPEAYRVSSPITYAEQVQAPVLIIQGQNDTRTAAQQLIAYQERMEALGKEIEVVWFDAGHGISAAMQATFHQRMVDFARRVLERPSTNVSAVSGTTP